MSLKYALDLLKAAHSIIEIKDGPFSKGKHALTLEKDYLMLSINTGLEFKNFILDDRDLNKDPQDLILEILGYLETYPTLDLKGMN